MVIGLESLEDRLVLSAGPITPLHFASLANFVQGSYSAPGDPGSAGFNLADVHSPAEVNALPPGVKGLVWVGFMTNGADSNFTSFISQFIGNPKVYGFYLADEPNPSTVPAANLKAESDWIHANDPGVETFFVINNSPYYTPANTDIDLIGLDSYPITTSGVNYNVIPTAVYAAERLGWANSQIVPIYQAFGGAGMYVVPTAEQEQMILDIWGNLVSHPAFDYAYSWGDETYQGMVHFPDLQAVFMAHNSNQQPPSSVALNSNQPPASPVALLMYGLERLEMDLFMRLATVQRSFALEAQQAHAALQANPWNGTALGSMVAASVDQQFASWEASL